MTPEGRPAATHPSMAEFRRVAQPPEVRGRRGAEHWTADLYLRRVSPYLSRALVRTSVSADAVTVAMIVVGVGAGAALLLPGLAGALLAVLATQVQMLLDCVDGEVARWRRRTSARGVFLDRIGHYTSELAIAGALGVRAGQGTGDVVMLVLGAALAALVVLNRAVNDMVHASRAVAGLSPLSTDGAASAPRGRGLGKVWSAARIVPVHRSFHSVELTLLVAVAALVDLVRPEATQVLLLALVPLAALTVVGHVVAVLASDRLRRS